MTKLLTEDDIDVVDFARILRSLDPHLPISDSYERDEPQAHGTWWESQREHMVSWFFGQTTLGSDGFTRSEPNRSAKKTYNRLACPAAFIWIAEALGEHPTVVQAAADAARAEPEPRKRSALIRKHLPWPRIAELALQE